MKTNINEVRRELGLITASEMAALLDMNAKTFFRLVERGAIPRPQKKWIGSPKEFYDEASIKHIKKLLEVK